MLTLPALGLVWLGGAVGTTARYLVGREVPHAVGVPVATIGVNVLGAFALGLLLEGLTDGGAGRTATRLRLLLGTGVLGGFTTYSALAVDTALLLDGSRVAAAAAYAVGTLLLGVLACAAGVLLAARRRRRRRRGPVQ